MSANPVLIDTHCHLCDRQFQHDYGDILLRARAAGVAAFVNVARDDAKWYIVSSETGEKGTPAIPWGWSWDVMHHYLFEPAVGDYDGDGRHDILWQDAGAFPTASDLFVWYFEDDPAHPAEEPATRIDWGWQAVGAGDYDGDGRDDLQALRSNGRKLVLLGNSRIYSDLESWFETLVKILEQAKEK